GPHIKALQRSIFYKGGFRTLLAADHQKPLTVFTLEVRVHVRQENLANPVSDEIYKVKAHLVFVRKAVGVQPQNVAIITNADHKHPAMGVQETSDRLQRR